MTTMSRTDRIEDYLTRNPGEHRARDIARALGMTNHEAALTLYHLERTGRASRRRITPRGELPYSLWTTI